MPTIIQTVAGAAQFTGLAGAGLFSFAKFDATNQLGNTHRISLMFTLEAEQFKRVGGLE